MLTSPSEVFLSHAHQDKELAIQVAATLTRHGIPVWYSPTNILGAQQWHDEIGAALQRCDWFAVILSPAAVESKGSRENLYTPCWKTNTITKLFPYFINHVVTKSLLGNYAAFRWLISLVLFQTAEETYSVSGGAVTKSNFRSRTSFRASSIPPAVEPARLRLARTPSQSTSAFHRSLIECC